MRYETPTYNTDNIILQIWSAFAVKDRYKQQLREKKEECLNELEQKVKDLYF